MINLESSRASHWTLPDPSIFAPPSFRKHQCGLLEPSLGLAYFIHVPIHYTSGLPWPALLSFLGTASFGPGLYDRSLERCVLTVPGCPTRQVSVSSIDVTVQAPVVHDRC